MVMEMKTIDKFCLEYIDDFKLYLGILKSENRYSITGILIKDEKVTEYCETIDIADYDSAVNIYNIYRENKVFPSHFYNIIDDMCL